MESRQPQTWIIILAPRDLCIWVNFCQTQVLQCTVFFYWLISMLWQNNFNDKHNELLYWPCTARRLVHCSKSRISINMLLICSVPYMYDYPWDQLYWQISKKRERERDRDKRHTHTHGLTDRQRERKIDKEKEKTERSCLDRILCRFSYLMFLKGWQTSILVRNLIS